MSLSLDFILKDAYIVLNNVQTSKYLVAQNWHSECDYDGILQLQDLPDVLGYYVLLLWEPSSNIFFLISVLEYDK